MKTPGARAYAPCRVEDYLAKPTHSDGIYFPPCHYHPKPAIIHDRFPVSELPGPWFGCINNGALIIILAFGGLLYEIDKKGN